jgi:integrase-like protein
VQVVGPGKPTVDQFPTPAPVNPAGLAKHYFEPALAALGLDHVRWHDLRHAFAVLSLTAGEHYMAVSKILGHASYVTTLTVYADYITEGDGGKAAPLRRPVPSSVQRRSDATAELVQKAPKGAEWILRLTLR